MKRFLIQATYIFIFLWMFASCIQGPDKFVEKIIFVTHPALDMFVGEEVLITASPTLETYTWKSADDAVATVNSTGEVRAVSEGVTIITVSCGDVRREIPVSVAIKVPVTGLSISQSSVEIWRGEYTTLTANFLPENNNEKESNTLIWETSNPFIATVTAGKVVGVDYGTVTITATLARNPSIKASVEVSVKLSSYTMDISRFGNGGNNLLYSRVQFRSGEEITIQGIDRGLIAEVYNRDFMDYNPNTDRLTFTGETGLFDVYYSEEYKYFWICKINDGAPATYWMYGHGFSSCKWHEDFNNINSWSSGADIRTVSYMKSLGNNRYQATVYLTYKHDWGGFNFQIRSRRNDGTSLVFKQTALTGDIEGITTNNLEESSDINNPDSTVDGYYRITLNVTNNTLDFKKIN